MKQRYLSFVIPLVGMIVILGLAYGLDNLVEYLRALNARTFNLGARSFWILPLVDFVLAISVLIFFWYMNSRAARHWLVNFILVAVSLFFLLYMPLYFTLPAPLRIYLIAHPRLQYTSAFIAVTGLWGLAAQVRSVSRNTLKVKSE